MYEVSDCQQYISVLLLRLTVGTSGSADEVNELLFDQ